MKTALVLTGLLREYKEAFSTQKQNIIAPYNISNSDIFVNVWDDIGYWTPGDGTNQTGFEKTKKVSLSELQDIYESDNIIVHNFEEYEPQFNKISDEYEEFFVPSINHSNCLVRKKNLISMFFKIQEGIKMTLKTNYDVIVRTRPDLMCHESLPIFADYTTFFSLHHRNHIGSGIGDNLHISNQKNMIPFSTFMDNMHQLYIASNNILCPHLFCETILKVNNINHQEFNFSHTYMHTPGGQYKAKKGNDWVELGNASYERCSGRFVGECGIWKS